MNEDEDRQRGREQLAAEGSWWVFWVAVCFVIPLIVWLVTG